MVVVDATRLTPVENHLADVLALGPLGGVVTMPAAEAVGLRVATDLLAPGDLPAFASSALDGYAVRVADVPGTLPVAGDIAAGAVPTVAVEAGSAVRIMTGAVVPAGAEAVVGVEHTDGGTATVAITSAVTLGAAIRPAGSDVHAGEMVVAAGQRIGPAQLAALLSTGHVSVPVHRPPRVLVFSTGDELVPAGVTPGPAQLVDSNRPALLAAVAAAGAVPVDGGLIADDPEILLATLAGFVGDVDLVITSGGVSMGAFDVVKLALRDRGVSFVKVAMQPGMPQGIGRVALANGSVPFLGLPGNPVSALVSFTLFVRPLLARPARVSRLRLAEAVVRSPAAKVQYLRARRRNHTVSLVGEPGSHLLVGLARSDALVVVPLGVTSLEAGAEVDVLELEDTWS